MVGNYGTFRHEQGPSLLLFPDVYWDAFWDCDVECGFEMKQCQAAYQVVFDDGDAVNVGFPKNAMMLEEEVLPNGVQFDTE